MNVQVDNNCCIYLPAGVPISHCDVFVDTQIFVHESYEMVSPDLMMHHVETTVSTTYNVTCYVWQPVHFLLSWSKLIQPIKFLK
jgi:hypothetical protein